MQASAIAGALSGGVTALTFRGPKNVIPGVVCIATFGAVGQALYNRYDRRDTAKPGLWRSLTSARWSPLQSISDETYSSMLKEQLLKTQAEIAVLDDKIAALKREGSQDVQQSIISAADATDR